MWCALIVRTTHKLSAGAIEGKGFARDGTKDLWEGKKTTGDVAFGYGAGCFFV